ncbi:MAG: tail fiber domain-containing protein [Bacteroidetes bacterium]|nr:tail fiber domain-containing protein [Bacteroidota bacterium]
MKHIYLLMASGLFCMGQVLGQTPSKFNYQAAVRTSSGTPVASGTTVSFRFSLLRDSANGTLLYEETQSKTVNNTQGMVNLEIGGGTVTSGSFPGPGAWGSSKMFLKTEADPNGGASFVNIGTQQLMSVPFAMWAGASGSAGSAVNATHATKSDTAAHLAPTGVIDPAQISAAGASATQVLKWNGSQWAPAADVGGGSGDDWGTQTVVTDATLAGNGVTGNALKLAQNGATSGDVLKWNGSAWAPAAESNSTLTAGTGVSITSGVINSVWTRVNNDIYNNTPNNVGIGKSAPGRRLHVHWTTGQNGIRLTNNNSGSGNGFEMTMGGSSSSNLHGYLWNWANAGIRFGTNNVERMRIDSNGFTGYNTTTPKSPLHVYSTNTQKDSMTYLNLATVNGGEFQQVSGTGFVSGVFSTANSSSAKYNAGLTAVGYGGTYTYGVYGLGTGAGTGNYGVWGSAGGAGAYGVVCSGNGVYTGTWTQSSDARLKTDIQPISSGLDKVMQLKPSRYLFRTQDAQYKALNLAEGLHYGFIAQEVEKVLPEMVQSNKLAAPGHQNPFEFKSVNYVEMVALLTKAIQEQQQQIESLKSEVNKLGGNVK